MYRKVLLLAACLLCATAAPAQVDEAFRKDIIESGYVHKPLRLHEDKAVETVGIQSLPREREQVKFLEHIMQRLSFCQAAHIMKACIICHRSTTETLHTAAWLMLTLQHEHFLPFLAEQVGTHQAAQAASYDDNVVQSSPLKVIYCLFSSNIVATTV